MSRRLFHDKIFGKTMLRLTILEKERTYVMEHAIEKENANRNVPRLTAQFRLNTIC